MKSLEFKIEINATAEKVYKTLIDPDQVLDWVRVFSAESWYEGGWDKGADITFYTTDDKGVPCGLRCVVERWLFNTLILIMSP